MTQRPVSITVIGWLLIVFGLFGLLGCFAYIGMASSPMVQQAMALIPVPLSVQIAVTVASVVLRLATGIALLLRQNWARFLYATYGLAGIVYAYFVSPYPLLMIPGILLYLVVTVFLFLPAANVYFTKKDAAPPQRE